MAIDPTRLATMNDDRAMRMGNSLALMTRASNWWKVAQNHDLPCAFPLVRLPSPSKAVIVAARRQPLHSRGEGVASTSEGIAPLLRRSTRPRLHWLDELRRIAMARRAALMAFCAPDDLCPED